MKPARPRPTRPPWFGSRPRLAVWVAAGLFAGVLALRFAVADPARPVTLLFSLPIALLAMTAGRRGGLSGGLAAGLLLGTWAVLDGVALGPLDWLAAVLPLLLLGGLIGDATGRLRRSEAERVRLEAAAQRHRDAIEVNDSIVQGLTAARWSLEAGNVDQGLAIVAETADRASVLVSDLLRDEDRPRSARLPRTRRRT
jgi:predicted lipid-binding transport protein (Tim44 family)